MAMATPGRQKRSNSYTNVYNANTSTSSVGSNNSNTTTTRYVTQYPQNVIVQQPAQAFNARGYGTTTGGNRQIGASSMTASNSGGSGHALMTSADNHLYHVSVVSWIIITDDDSYIITIDSIQK